jgi:hypothetical protein
MQPLDVGIFGPMKYAWRAQLKRYADLDPTAKLLKKTEFPRMLKELLSELNPAEHLPKAFEKCGLVPINRQKVLDRIPSVVGTQDIAHHVDQALLKKLEVRRFGDGPKKQPRGKKVPAGQSYSATEDLQTSEEEESELEDEEVATDEEEVVDDVDEEMVENEELPDLDVAGPSSSRMGSYVVAAYEGEWYLAEVSRDQNNVARGYTRLSYMVIKGKNSFSWGDKPDLHVALNEDILLEAVSPEPVNSRGHLGLKKKDLQLVFSLMVVVYFNLFFILVGSFQPMIFLRGGGNGKVEE